MDGPKYINQLISLCKIGSKQDFENLWKSHLFIIDRVYDAFFTEYNPLKYKKLQLFQYYYVSFWEAINEHSFKDIGYFSYNVQEKLINKTIWFLQKECLLDKSRIPLKNDIKKKFKRKNDPFNENVYYAINALTAKQAQFVYYHVYEGKIFNELPEFLKVAVDTAVIMNIDSHKKMREVMHGKVSKSGIKKKIYMLPP